MVELVKVDPIDETDMARVGATATELTAGLLQ